MLKNRIKDPNIAAHLLVPDPLPRLILIISPCRSGSVALLRAFYENLKMFFSKNEFLCVFQPAKAILRKILDGEKIEDFKCPNGIKWLVVKETLGTDREIESERNFIKDYLEAGFTDIQVVFLEREPFSTAASWIENFLQRTRNKSKSTLIDNTNLAYKAIEEMRVYAIENNIPFVLFPYEAIRDHGDKAVLGSMYSKLGLPFTPEFLKGWDYGLNGIIFPHESWGYYNPLYYKDAKNSTEFRFRSKSLISVSNALETVNFVESLKFAIEKYQIFCKFAAKQGKEFIIKPDDSYYQKVLESVIKEKF